MSEHYRVLIRETHLDTFGHMNNATYLELFEESRWEYITQRGFGLKDIQKKGLGPVILEVQLKFLAEVRLREEIEITVEMVSYKGKISILRQRMLKSDGTVAAEAVFVFGLFDLKQRKLVDPTPEWLHALNWKG